MSNKQSNTFLSFESLDDDLYKEIQNLVNKRGENVRRYDSALVKLRKTKEEKEVKKKEYRENYKRRPEVIERYKKYNEDENVKRRRLEYNNREDIRERKKVLGKIRRKALKILEEEDKSRASCLKEKAAEILGFKPFEKPSKKRKLNFDESTTSTTRVSSPEGGEIEELSQSTSIKTQEGGYTGTSTRRGSNSSSRDEDEC